DTATPFYLDDLSINAMLGQYAYDEACAQCAESLGSYFAQQASMVIQKDLRVQYMNRSQFYVGLAKSIRDTAQPLPGDPINTGASFGTMATPNLSDYRVDLPAGDPNAPAGDNSASGTNYSGNYDFSGSN
ncbi:MAG: hypothetical protein ACREBW_06430, partial [Candidatus Micrarchaeaceae archaeon]